MKKKMKTILSLCAIFVMMCSVFVNADSYSSWRYTGNINGYKYKYRSGIMNYSGSVRARAHTEVTNGKSAPKGYMAARTYLYQKGGLLKASSNWVKNSSKMVGMDIAGAEYSSNTGAFYCIAKFKYKKNSTSYSSVYTAYETSCVGPLGSKGSAETATSNIANLLDVSELKKISIIKESDDGHTYGSGMCTELGMKCPDFIAAIGESGIEGYVKSKDLEISDETGASIIEMEPGDVNLSFIPLYSESGKIIGKFKLETRCYAVEDGGNNK